MAGVQVVAKLYCRHRQGEVRQVPSMWTVKIEDDDDGCCTDPVLLLQTRPETRLRLNQSSMSALTRYLLFSVDCNAGIGTRIGLAQLCPHLSVGDDPQIPCSHAGASQQPSVSLLPHWTCCGLTKNHLPCPTHSIAGIFVLRHLQFSFTLKTLVQ